MKAKVDQKLIDLFVIIIIMVGVVFYFLNKKEKENREMINNINNQTVGLQVIQSKQAKFDSLVKSIKNIFAEAKFDSFTRNLKTYINLPIDTGRVGNPYPFGNYRQSTEELK